MTFTKDQIVEYVYNSKPAINFYHFAMGIGFWPDFPDNQIEDLAWFLNTAEVRDIKRIDQLLVQHEETLKKYIAHIYANRKNPWRVTPGFLCALAIIIKFPKSFTVDKLVQNNWDEDLASIIIAAANKFNSNLA